MRKLSFWALVAVFVSFSFYSCKVAVANTQPHNNFAPIASVDEDEEDFGVLNNSDEINNIQLNLVNVYKTYNYKYTDSELELKVLEKVESKISDDIRCTKISKISSDSFYMSNGDSDDKIDIIRYQITLSDGRIIDAIATDDKRAGAILYHSDPYFASQMIIEEDDKAIDELIKRYVSYISLSWSDIVKNYSVYLTRANIYNNNILASKVDNGVVVKKIDSYIKTKFGNDKLHATVLADHGIRPAGGFCAATAAAQIITHYDAPILTYSYKDFPVFDQREELKGTIEMSDREIRDLIFNPKSDTKSLLLRQRIINSIIYSVYNSIYYNEEHAVNTLGFFSFKSLYYYPRVTIGNGRSNEKMLGDITNLFSAFDNREPIMTGLRRLSKDVGHAVLLDGLYYDSRNPEDAEVHINWGYAGKYDGWYKYSAVLTNVNDYKMMFAWSYGYPQNKRAKLDLGYDEGLYNYSTELGGALRIKSADDEYFTLVGGLKYKQTKEDMLDYNGKPIKDDNGNVVKVLNFDGTYAKTWDGKLYVACFDRNELVDPTSANWIEWDGKDINNCYDVYIRGEGNTNLSGICKRENHIPLVQRPILSVINIDPDAGVTRPKVTISGDVMDLLDYKENRKYKTIENTKMPTMAPYCFAGLFMDNYGATFDNIVLPSKDLSEHCFDSMFSNCQSMEIPPVLGATVLAPYCYSSMFSGCTKLKYICYLPTSHSSDHAYFNMFKNCSSLQVSTDSAGADYYIIPGGGAGMFTGVIDYNKSNNPITITSDTQKIYTKNKPVGKDFHTLVVSEAKDPDTGAVQNTYLTFQSPVKTSGKPRFEGGEQVSVAGPKPPVAANKTSKFTKSAGKKSAIDSNATRVSVSKK